MRIERVYHEYFTYVYKFALSLTGNPDEAEEITQETFFRAVKKIDNFRGESSIRVWLCQIAKNIYYDHMRRAKKTEILHQPDAAADENASKHTRSPEELLVEKQTAFDIHQIIHNLKEPYKEVFILKTYADISYTEIGKLFGRSENWVRVTYYRARLMIKEGIHENSM